MDFVALDVEVPQAIVGGALRQFDAFFELVQPLLDAQLFHSGGQRIAEKLQQQLQIHVPGASRQCVGEAKDAGWLTEYPEGNQQH